MTGKILLGGAIATGLFFAFRGKKETKMTVTDTPLSELPPIQSEELPPLQFNQQAIPNTQLQPANNSNVGCCGNPKYLS